jgi:predicted AAA+ superfamily ATPase
MTFPDKPYLSLEDPDIAHLARTDPRGFLASYPDGLILDEAQYVPEIFTWLKTAADAQPEPGKYIITGSQQFHLLEKITESLAGRAALLTLRICICGATIPKMKLTRSLKTATRSPQSK